MSFRGVLVPDFRTSKKFRSNFQLSTTQLHNVRISNSTFQTLQMKVDDLTNDGISQNSSTDINDENELHQTIENNNINVIENQQDYLFRCAICGTAEGDSSSLSSNISLQTNATVRCGHQL